MNNKILILGGRGTFPTEYENNVTWELLLEEKGYAYTPQTVTQDNKELVRTYIRMGKEIISRGFTTTEEDSIHRTNIENLGSGEFIAICLIEGWRTFKENSIRELEFAAENRLEIFEVIPGDPESPSPRTLHKIVPVLEFKYTFPTE